MSRRCRPRRSAVDIFLIAPVVKQYHPCQAPSRAKAWFHDSAGDSLWILTAREINMGNCHPKKTNVQSNFFWNITHRQAISPVANFLHVLGRGFMIQWMILILSNVSQPIRIDFFTSKYNIDFYQMSHSQSESTILHESIIFLYINYEHVIRKLFIYF